MESVGPLTAELPTAAIYFAKELRAKGIPVGIPSCNWSGTTASAWMERRWLEADPVLRVYTDKFDRLVSGLDMVRYQAVRVAVRLAMESPASQAGFQILLKICSIQTKCKRSWIVRFR